MIDESLQFLLELIVDETIDRLGERFVQGDLLGEGRFSKVRKAKATASQGVGLEVALKGMALSELEEDDEALQMLEAEVGALRRAAQCADCRRHVVRLHQVLRTSDTIYLALDLVSGSELFTLVERHGALPEVLARALVQQLVLALASLHRSGAPAGWPQVAPPREHPARRGWASPRVGTPCDGSTQACATEM